MGTQFLIAAEPFNPRKYAAERKGEEYSEKDKKKRGSKTLGSTDKKVSSSGDKDFEFDDERSASSPRESLVSTNVGPGGLDTVSEIDSVAIDIDQDSERGESSPERGRNRVASSMGGGLEVGGSSSSSSRPSSSSSSTKGSG